MLRINLAAGVAMAFVLVLSAIVLLQVAAPHVRWCPGPVRRWAGFVTDVVVHLRDGDLEDWHRTHGRRPRTR